MADTGTDAAVDSKEPPQTEAALLEAKDPPADVPLTRRSDVQRCGACNHENPPEGSTTAARLRACPCGIEWYCNTKCQTEARPDHRDVCRAALSREPIEGLPMQDSRLLRAFHFVWARAEETIAPLVQAIGNITRSRESLKRYQADFRNMVVHMGTVSNRATRLLTELVYRVFEAHPELSTHAFADYVRAYNQTRRSCLLFLALAPVASSAPPVRNGVTRAYRICTMLAPDREMAKIMCERVGSDLMSNYDGVLARLEDAGFQFTDDVCVNEDPSAT